ncbi:jg19913 [Pararge aegeria aegeria]|uniref:Jg19913 protein n=1 Tax=Pararge aegeria aegeria TaxID=348720 RepID=A0A8S4SHS9_9NEOP|nr:jg19913 [Pararge aegeria aegeria]
MVGVTKREAVPEALSSTEGSSLVSRPEEREEDSLFNPLWGKIAVVLCRVVTFDENTVVTTSSLPAECRTRRLREYNGW